MTARVFGASVAPGLALLVSLVLATPAAAQPFGRDRGGAPGEFDFWVLALSWSPGWCRTEGRGRRSAQCDPGRNPGFVLHGLWPQYERGYPSACGASPRSPSRVALDAAAGVYPDLGLARHEWSEHGTCSGLDPRRYFETAAAAFRAVTVPARLARPEQAFEMTPADVERAFAAANRGLAPGMISVQCRGGALTEVRLCLDRSLNQYRACPQVDRDTCRAPVISVPASP